MEIAVREEEARDAIAQQVEEMEAAANADAALQAERVGGFPDSRSRHAESAVLCLLRRLPTRLTFE